MKCKDCGADGFANPWAIRKHKESAHGAAPPAAPESAPPRAAKTGQPKRKYTRRAALEPPAAAAPVEDAESKLLAICCNAFANADTDREADARVLEYLASRWGPSAYEGVDE